MTLPMKLAAGAVGLGLLGALAWWSVATWNHNHSQAVRVSGNIEVTDAEVSFKIPGRVLKRLVDEGERVQKGQLVAVLDSSDLESELAIRRAELAGAQVAMDEATVSRPHEIAAAEAAVRRADWGLKLLKEGFRVEEIEVARHMKQKAEVEMNRTQADYDRAKRLIEGENRAISAEEYDRAKAAYEVAFERFNEADWQLRLFEKGSRQQQIEEAKAALEEAQAQCELVRKQEKIGRATARRDQAAAAVRLAETRLGYATLVAPLSGIVISKNTEPGEYVAPGTPVVTVGDLENVWLRAYINGTDLGRVRVGQTAEVTIDTFPDKKYTGRVSFISEHAEFTPKSVQTQKERVKLVYRIKIDLANPEMELKPGMPADAEILVAPK